MGAGNYCYTSPKLGRDNSEQYHTLFYLDEYECDEYGWSPVWIKDDLIALLTEHLKDFNPDTYGYEDDLCWQWGRECESVLGTVGRMTILTTHTYYGDRLAVVITPNSEWQDKIDAITSGRIYWEDFDASERANWASAIRTVRSSALEREMDKIRKRILHILDKKGGLAEAISFRAGPWCSARYVS